MKSLHLGNCGIIQRSQGARPAEMSVKSASRHRELTASSATQFRSRFSSAKSDAYKVHALVRILFAARQSGLRGFISRWGRIADIPAGYAGVPQSLVGNFWHFGSCGAGFGRRSLVAIFQFPFRGCRDRFDSRQRAVYIRHERLLSILTRCRQPKLLHRPRSCFPGPRQAFRLGCPTLGSSAAQGSPSSRARCGDPRRRRHRGRGEGAEGPGRRCAACHPRRRRGRHLAGGRRSVAPRRHGARQGKTRMSGTASRS